MKVPGYAIERGCSWTKVGPCDFDGVVAVVCDWDGNYVGQTCEQHRKLAMFEARREVEGR